ncbi:MAG TPA: glycosyltransferase family 2 protein [Clostridia bacterium]|nr:glycosyltransferase family 2 protein [Clostridia bacterium]
MKKIKNKKTPLVTVLITVFNTEAFLALALESIVKQTYKNLEIVVVDDGSSDKTAQIIKKFARADQRIKPIFLKKNLGPSLASNLGLEKAQGEFIARMDADDIAFPDRIERQLNFLLAHPEVVLLGGQCFLINQESEVVGEKLFPLTNKEIYKALFAFNPIQHPTCLVNRRLLPKARLFYHNHSLLAHDLELVFELSQYGQLANLPQKVLYYRQDLKSLSRKDAKETFRATLAIRKKALREYGYQPSLKAWLIHFTQVCLISILPKAWIYPLFKFFRLEGVKDKNAKGLASGWRNIFTGACLRDV